MNCLASRFYKENAKSSEERIGNSCCEMKEILEALNAEEKTFVSKKEKM